MGACAKSEDIETAWKIFNKISCPSVCCGMLYFQDIVEKKCTHAHTHKEEEDEEVVCHVCKHAMLAGPT